MRKSYANALRLESPSAEERGGADHEKGDRQGEHDRSLSRRTLKISRRIFRRVKEVREKKPISGKPE
jgi:hypothetical protein